MKVVLGLQSWPFNWAPNSNPRWVNSRPCEGKTVVQFVFSYLICGEVAIISWCRASFSRLQHQGLWTSLLSFMASFILSPISGVHMLLVLRSGFGLTQEEAVYELETGKPRSLEELPTVLPGGCVQHLAPSTRGHSYSKMSCCLIGVGLIILNTIIVFFKQDLSFLSGMYHFEIGPSFLLWRGMDLKVQYLCPTDLKAKDWLQPFRSLNTQGPCEQVAN